MKLESHDRPRLKKELGENLLKKRIITFSPTGSASVNFIKKYRQTPQQLRRSLRFGIGHALRDMLTHPPEPITEFDAIAGTPGIGALLAEGLRAVLTENNTESIPLLRLYQRPESKMIAAKEGIIRLTNAYSHAPRILVVSASDSDKDLEQRTVSFLREVDFQVMRVICLVSKKPGEQISLPPNPYYRLPLFTVRELSHMKGGPVIQSKVNLFAEHGGFR